MRVGIIAALAGEVKPLVKSWTRVPSRKGTHKWILRTNGIVWIVACSGMGADAARRSFVEAEEDGPLDLVLTIGWAGALDPALDPGQALSVAAIIDAQTGERFQLTDCERGPTLVTAVGVADAAEKARLRATYLAAMVDMEGAVVARMAQMRGIPVLCVKGVSDGAAASLPDINPFIDPMGQLRTFALLAYIAARPVYWPSFAQLGRNSRKAAQAMCDIVLKFIEEKNADRLDHAGSP
jgi:adenosylhomocysteine nucleosidase